MKTIAGPSRGSRPAQFIDFSSSSHLYGLNRRYASSSPKHITVLGAGLTGLYTAYRLSSSPDVKVTLLESSDRVGGWVDSRNHPVSFRDASGKVIEGGVTLESGPRSIRPKGSKGAAGMLKLIRDLGLEDQIMPIPTSHPAAKNRFLLDTKTSQLVKLPSSLPSLLASRHPLVKDLIPSVVKEPFRSARPAELSDESVDSFISRRFGPGVAEMLSAMIHGIYAASSRDLSVRSGMGLLWDAEEARGSVVMGMLRGYRSAAEKAEEQAGWDSLGALGKERAKWSLYGLRGGLGVITNGLLDRIRSNGVDIRLNHQASRVQPVEGQVEIETKASGKIVTDHIVSAIPPPYLDALIRPKLPHLAHNPYTSVGVVSLVYPGRPQTYHPDGFGYLIPRSDAKANPEGVLGVVFDSTALPGIDDEGMDGHVTKLTVMMGGPYWSSYHAMKRPLSAGELVQPALQHIGRVLPNLGQVKPLVTSPRLHTDSIPTYLPGHGQRLKELGSALLESPWRGKLSLVGNGFGGVGVNDCVYSGETVARALLEGREVTGLERWRDWK